MGRAAKAAGSVATLAPVAAAAAAATEADVCVCVCVLAVEACKSAPVVLLGTCLSWMLVLLLGVSAATTADSVGAAAAAVAGCCCCCCWHRELKQQLAEVHPELYKQLQQELAAEED